MTVAPLPDAAMLAGLAASRQFMPGVHGRQSHLVKYSGSDVNVSGGWLACNSNGTQGNFSSSGGAPPVLPEAVRFSVVEAPAEWCWPLRTDKCFKPPFKVGVEIAHNSVLDLALQLSVHVLSEEEVESIGSWLPPGHNNQRTTLVPSSASLKGTTTRSVIVEAGKYNSWSTQRAAIVTAAASGPPGPVPATAQPVLGNACSLPMDQHTGLNDLGAARRGSKNMSAASSQLETLYAQRMSEVQEGLGLPPDSNLLLRLSGSLSAPSSNGSNAAFILPASGSVDPQQSCAKPGRPAAQVDGPLEVGVHGHMLTKEQFVFSDLRFGKPSRMAAVYIAFTCTINATGDRLVALYKQPTISTCRAEQWNLACQRLGVPSNPQQCATTLLQNTAAAAGQRQVITSLETGPQASDVVVVGRTKPGRMDSFNAQRELSASPTSNHADRANVPKSADYMGSMSMQAASQPAGRRQVASSRSFNQHTSGNGVMMGGLAAEQQQQGRPDEGMKMLNSMNGHNAPESSESAAHAVYAIAGNVAAAHVLAARPCISNPGTTTTSESSGGGHVNEGPDRSGSYGLAAMTVSDKHTQHGQHMHYHQQLPQRLVSQQLPVISSLPVNSHDNQVAREVKEWCSESFASLGLVRPLSDGDLDALLVMSGANEPHSEAFRLQLMKFKSQFKSLLHFMRHIPGLWNMQHPAIVGGFTVTRDAATAKIMSEPCGTFLCRLSISSGVGGLALAIKPMMGLMPGMQQDRVVHVLITAADLETQTVHNILQSYQGTTHVLDPYTSKRIDKRKVFACDYMRLGDFFSRHRSPAFEDGSSINGDSPDHSDYDVGPDAAVLTSQRKPCSSPSLQADMSRYLEAVPSQQSARQQMQQSVPLAGSTRSGMFSNGNVSYDGQRFSGSGNASNMNTTQGQQQQQGVQHTTVGRPVSWELPSESTSGRVLSAERLQLAPKKRQSDDQVVQLQQQQQQQLFQQQTALDTPMQRQQYAHDRSNPSAAHATHQQQMTPTFAGRLHQQQHHQQQQDRPQQSQGMALNNQHPGVPSANMTVSCDTSATAAYIHQLQQLACSQPQRSSQQQQQHVSQVPVPPGAFSAPVSGSSSVVKDACGQVQGMMHSLHVSPSSNTVSSAAAAAATPGHRAPQAAAYVSDRGTGQALGMTHASLGQKHHHPGVSGMLTVPPAAALQPTHLRPMLHQSMDHQLTPRQALHGQGTCSTQPCPQVDVSHSAASGAHAVIDNMTDEDLNMLDTLGDVDMLLNTTQDSMCALLDTRGLIRSDNVMSGTAILNTEERAMAAAFLGE